MDPSPETARFRVAPRGAHELSLREGGQSMARISHTEALDLAGQLLRALDWDPEGQLGIAVQDREPKVVTPDQLDPTLQRLRAAGLPVTPMVMERPIWVGPWRRRQPRENLPQRMTKEVSKATMARTSPVRIDERRIRAREREALAALAERAVIQTQLFDDPVEQLHYEVRHMYLHSVPPAQRREYPLRPFAPMDCFLADLEAQAAAVSRQQMISVIVDIVCNRVWDVQSRQARAKREGGGEEGRAQVVRSFDGALAWRANVSSNTPAARRAMWWQRSDGVIELCRLAAHDDMTMPER